MLRGESASRIQQRYEELQKRKNNPSSCISTSFTNVAALCRKRYQMMHPELGLAHCCNEAFLPLMTFCGRYRDYHSDEDRQTLVFHENLKTALDDLNFLPCPEEQRQSYQKLDALTELYRDPQFVQINNFMTDFKKWLDGGFTTAEGDAKPIRLEPFQKNLLIHVIFFIAVTKIPVLANRVLQYLVHAFEIDFLSQTSVEVFKQKATVFLVPRRHGKTWFIIPIICFLLKNMIGISIGYVAHQKHVSQFVLKEVKFRCRHTFAKDYVVENKGLRDQHRPQGSQQHGAVRQLLQHQREYVHLCPPIHHHVVHFRQVAAFSALGLPTPGRRTQSSDRSALPVSPLAKRWHATAPSPHPRLRRLCDNPGHPPK